MSQNFTARTTDKSFLQIPIPTEKAPMTEQGFNKQDWHRLLISLGEDPDRAGLVETPSRIAKVWKHWTFGYAKDPAECLKIFEEGAQDYNERLQVQERLTIQIGNALMTYLEPQAVGFVIRCRHFINTRHTATQPLTARGIFRRGACGVILFCKNWHQIPVPCYQ